MASAMRDETLIVDALEDGDSEGAFSDGVPDLDVLESDRLDEETTVYLSPEQEDFVFQLVEKILLFAEELAGEPYFGYQRELAFRIVESLVINDGEEITALWSRQSGKTQTVGKTLAACMVLFPKLAPIYPEYFEKFKNGLWVGIFAPVEEQAETLHQRLVGFLSSDEAVEILTDPEIDESLQGKGKFVKITNGSFVRQQTAHPRAKIESKSYHVVVIDEAQEADDYTVSKSIHPMLAFYNGTIVKTGTASRTKGNYYKAIQHNKRRQTKKGARQNHFEFNWRYCAKSNPNYAKFIKKEMARIGQESDEFQLSYELRWLLNRGMFTTESQLEMLGDRSMERVQFWKRTPVVVGIDPARTVDSTVVTVVYIDWDRPDELGYFHHRVLNWLELTGDDWEDQYFQIVDFLANYNVWAIAVDATGVGDVVADRLARLLPDVEVVPIDSNTGTQSRRWKHLQQLIERGMVVFPWHAKTRRLKIWQRFHQQMVDLEKRFIGPHMIAEAPDETDAHDDFPDSLALACVLSLDTTMPEIEVSENVFYR